MNNCTPECSIDFSPIIREINKSEYPFLEEMLYQAIFIPEGQEKLPREIIFQPELSRYFLDFGKSKDFCLVAINNEELIGAIWIRLFNAKEQGYGYVNDETPELSMAVKEEYRRKGIGKLLFDSMFGYLKKQNFNQISLSVDKQNFAYNFYKKKGFVEFTSTSKTAIMIRKN